jgi:O-antigen ligase
VILIGLQLIKKRATHARRVIATAVVALLLVVPPLSLVWMVFGSSPAAEIVQATGRNMTFTGRTLIWTDIINIAEKQPLLGVGIGALWVGHIGDALYPMPTWSAVTPGWRPTEAHNGYVDTYAQIGLVGLVLLMIVIGCAIRGTLDDLQRNFEFGTLRLTLFLAVLLCDMTETSFLLAANDLWFIFLLLGINLPASAISPQKRDGVAREADRDRGGCIQKGAAFMSVTADDLKQAKLCQDPALSPDGILATPAALHSRWRLSRP